MKKPFCIKARLNSFVYAGKGIGKFIGREHNAWIHCLIVLIVTCAGFYFRITRQEWVFILLCFALVLAAEAFNTAIERLADKASTGQNALAADVKDIAAGAVLICAIVAAIVGVIVFLPYVLNVLHLNIGY